MSDSKSSVIKSAEGFINSVAEYAEAVFERCVDKYGEKESPLFTDGINPTTGEPAKWEAYVVSNLACQQNFLRILDGLSALTGEKKYKDQALGWIKYALGELQDPASGMLYWGGHTSYDLIDDRPLLGNHELKCVYPYYAFLYGVDPKATRLAIEGTWNKHIKDWASLLFNRHGEYTEWQKDAAWEHEYLGGPLPIVENSTLSFINTGSDLIYAGTQLAILSGSGAPLQWSKRLLGRYNEIRNKDTDLGGYQFNHREPCRVRISFREPMSDRQDVNETTVITNGVIQTRYGRAALTFMNLYEELGEAEGGAFRDFVDRDLKALAKYSYDPEDHSFIALLNDGMKLSPSNTMKGVGYCGPQKLEKVPANGLMFLSYVRAYCITGDSSFWKTARSLAQGLGWTEIFDVTSDQSAAFKRSMPAGYTMPLPTGSAQDHAFALSGLIELYKATEQAEYLNLAVDLGREILQRYFADGFFAVRPDAKGGYASIDNSLPLVLLHLAAAAMDKQADLPLFYPNSTFFDPKVVVSRRKRGE